MCKNQEAGTGSKVNEFYWLIWLINYNISEVPSTQWTLKKKQKTPAAVTIRLLWAQIWSLPTCEQQYSRNNILHSPQHNQFMTSNLDYSLTKRWVTGNKPHICATYNVMSVDMLHTPRVLFIQKCLTCPWNPSLCSPPHSPQAIAHILPWWMSLHFLEFYRNGIIWYVLFFIWPR